MIITKQSDPLRKVYDFEIQKAGAFAKQSLTIAGDLRADSASTWFKNRAVKNQLRDALIGAAGCAELAMSFSGTALTDTEKNSGYDGARQLRTAVGLLQNKWINDAQVSAVKQLTLAGYTAIQNLIP